MWVGDGMVGGMEGLERCPRKRPVSRLRSPEGRGFPQGKWAPNPSVLGQEKSYVRLELKPIGASGGGGLDR